VRTILLAGSVKPRPAAVLPRRHLRKTEVIAGREYPLAYDVIVAIRDRRDGHVVFSAPAESAAAPAADVMAGDATRS
jgi:hypothetical protein